MNSAAVAVPALNPTLPLVPPAGAGIALADVIALSLLQQMQNNNSFSRPHSRPRTPMDLNHSKPTTAPTSPIKDHGITLDMFCEQYSISDEEHDRLAKLKYLPGDKNVKKLERIDWHDDAGFATLEWNRFLDIHDKFVASLRR
jgi:hypothetical protein